MPRKIKVRIVENKDKLMNVSRIEDIPPAYEDDDFGKLHFTDEFFNMKSREEIEEEEVKMKWKQFLSGLTTHQKSILKNLLGLDKQKFSVEEIDRIQRALKGDLKK